MTGKWKSPLLRIIRNLRKSARYPAAQHSFFAGRGQARSTAEHKTDTVVSRPTSRCFIHEKPPFILTHPVGSRLQTSEAPTASLVLATTVSYTKKIHRLATGRSRVRTRMFLTNFVKTKTKMPTKRAASATDTVGSTVRLERFLSTDSRKQGCWNQALLLRKAHSSGVI